MPPGASLSCVALYGRAQSPAMLSANAEPLENILGAYGEVIAAMDGSPRGWIVFFPPAVGEGGQQRAEAEFFARQGLSSLLYVPPYLRPQDFTGGVQDPPGERRRWQAARAEVAAMIRAIQARAPGRPVVLIGKNQGGSVASFCTDAGVAALVVSGSVPQLSSFPLASSHPSAQRSRGLATYAQLEHYRESTRAFDLLHTASAHAVPLLLQFGTRDEWILPRQLEALQAACPGRVEVSDDDHEMNAVATVERRRQFVLTVLVSRTL